MRLRNPGHSMEDPFLSHMVCRPRSAAFDSDSQTAIPAFILSPDPARETVDIQKVPWEKVETVSQSQMLAAVLREHR